MSQRVTLHSKVKPTGGAVAKASVNSAIESYGLDTKPSDLSMARLKQG